MPWRIVKQPNGLLARFSDVVDNFTHLNMTEEQAYECCHESVGVVDAKVKLKAGLEDRLTWATPGSGHDRWDKCLKTIELVYGKGGVKRIIKLLEKKE